MYTYPVYQPQPGAYPPTVSTSITPEGGSHFTVYPAPLPMNPYFPPLEHYVNYDSEPKESSKSTAKTPRPPNAWILYRSDKLKAIANGETIPGLEAVMNQSGLSGSGTSEGEEAQKKPKKKPRKGAKEPSKGILSLGRGKTGRGLPQADISKMISLLWKKEKPEAKAKYERMAEIKKLEVSELPTTLMTASRTLSWLQISAASAS